MKSKTLSKAGYFQRFQTFAMNRMVPPSVMEKDGLYYWRARILFAIIFTAVLIGRNTTQELRNGGGGKTVQIISI